MIWQEKCVRVAADSLFFRMGIENPVLNAVIRSLHRLTVEKAEGDSVAPCADVTLGSMEGVTLAGRIIDTLLNLRPYGKDVFAWKKTI